MDITEMDLSEWVESEELQAHAAKLAANAEAFLASCGKDELEVYRIEDFTPTLQAKESHGKFYSGDSYVVIKQSEAEYDIHYWHGEECTTDEMGSSAAFSVQLSAKLPKDSSHHLEQQHHESEEFASYFKNGIEYLKGGVASGFHYIDKKVEEPRLLRCMGKTAARVFEVECTANSINEGDVFILETPDKLFYWEGKDCNVAEKGKAYQYIQSMRRYERHCQSEIVYPKEEQEIDDMFWKYLGGKPDKINPAKDDESALSNEAQLQYKLWQIKSEGTKVNLTEIADRPLKKSMLDTNNVYILETFNKVQIWIGKEAQLDEKKNSLVIGKGFVKQHNKPKGTRVLRIVEGTESQLFKTFFEGFFQDAKVKLGEQNEYKVEMDKIANKKQEVVANLLNKLGKHTVKVYLNKDDKNIEIPEEQYGHFFSDEVYAIDIQGENHRYLIQWVGPRLPGDELSELRDYLDKLTNYEHHPAKVTRLTVTMGHEDDTLLKFFTNGFVVHNGPHLDMAQLNDKLTAEGGMYRIQGPFGETPQAIQQEAIKCELLNSNQAFFVIKPDGSKTAFAWMGAGCSDGERLYNARLEKILNVNSCTEFDETDESEDFWATLGGKTEYSSTKNLGFAPGFDPRMFQISVNSGLNKMDEIKNFRQEDLNNFDVHVIDAYSTLWVWTGNKSNKFEHKASIKRTEEYKNALTDGRDPKKIQVCFIEPCNEPFNFRGLFPEWSEEYSTRWVEKEKVSKPAAVADVDSKYLNPKEHKFDLDTLKTSFPEGVNPQKKEDYLEDSVFQEVFGMGRREFAELKLWRQQNAKKKVGLF